jgi:nucleoside-diphosphate-sugar epimerase
MTGKTDGISVFGGTGFIGSHFCSIDPDRMRVEPKLETVPSCEDIVYFISTTHNYNVLSDLHLDVDTNLTHLLKVLKNCKEGDCIFNFISSWFVYGESELPVSESAHCDPKGFYSITKRCAEQLLISFCETFGVPYRILRLGNVYGGGDKYSAKKNALQYLINELKNNRDIQLYHGGKVIRDYVHVEDVARAIMYCVDNAPMNEIINIGSNCEPVPLNILMEQAKTYLGSASVITAREPAPFHKIVQVKDMWLDSTKLEDLGFTWKHNILSDLEEVCRS